MILGRGFVPARPRAYGHERTRPWLFLRHEVSDPSPHPKKIREGVCKTTSPLGREKKSRMGERREFMSTAAKRTENMAKNLTQEELLARQQAEEEVMPDRPEGVKLQKPKLMNQDKVAYRYWEKVLERMKGLKILDNLDSDALGVYCSMLSRFERIGKQAAALSARIDEMDDLEPKDLVKLVEATNALESKTQALERNILQYAEKLGLTPSGRARLAVRRAENAGEEDPDADLFG